MGNIEEGFDALNKNDYIKAKICFKKAIIDSPDETAFFGLSMVYRNLKKPEKAKFYLSKIFENNKTNPDYYFLYSSLSLEQGDHIEAIKAGEMSLKLNPNNDQTYTVLSKAYLKNDDMKNAKMAAEMAYKIKQDEYTATAIGNIHMVEDEYMEALEYYKAATEFDLTDSLNMNFEIGRCYAAMGKYKKAYEYFMKSSRTPDYDYNVGLSLMGMGKYKKALKLFTDTDDCANCFCLGDCYANIGNSDLAEKYFRRAILLKPDNRHPYVILSNFYNDEERYNDSIKIADVGITNAPDQRLYAHKCHSLIQLKKYKEALDVVEEGLKMDDEIGTFLRLRVLKALLLREMGNVKEADLIIKNLAKNPDNKELIDEYEE